MSNDGECRDNVELVEIPPHDVCTKSSEGVGGESAPPPDAPPRHHEGGKCCRRLLLFHELANSFGFPVTALVTVVYLAVKGVGAQFMSAGLPLFRDVFHVSGADYQRLANVGIMAWAMKPLIGIVSDTTPLRGFHKRNYMLCAAFLALIPSMIIAVLPGTTSWSSIAAVCAFAINMSFATLDLLTEGRYSELMVLKPETGSSFVSWAWGCAMAGGTVASLIQGPLADHGYARIPIALIAPLMLLVAWPIARNWLVESRVSPHSTFFQLLSGSGRARTPTRHWIAVYSIAMALGTIATAVVSLLANRATIVAVTVTVPLALSAFSFAALPRMVANANLFMFLKEVLYVQLNGALDYYYVAGPSCVPNGPGFTYTYYQTFSNVIGYAAGGVGVVLFQKYFAKRSFRFAFWMTTLVKIVSSMFDIVLVERINVSIGIPDRLAYFLGDAVINAVCSMMDFMPAVVLISKLCPKGMEATMFALLAGFSNFGQVTSSTIGYLLIGVFGIRTEEPCDFTNLSALIFLAHGVLPLLVIPLTFLLVPPAKMTDPLLDAGATADDVLKAVEDEPAP